MTTGQIMKDNTVIAENRYDIVDANGVIKVKDISANDVIDYANYAYYYDMKSEDDSEIDSVDKAKKIIESKSDEKVVVRYESGGTIPDNFDEYEVLLFKKENFYKKGDIVGYPYLAGYKIGIIEDVTPLDDLPGFYYYSVGGASYMADELRPTRKINPEVYAGGGSIPKLRSIRVIYDDGTIMNTSMDAGLTDKEILDYYAIGREFNIGSGENNKMAKVVNAEITDKKKYRYDGMEYTEQELIDLADTTSEYDRRDSGEEEGNITTIEQALEYLGDAVEMFGAGGIIDSVKIKMVKSGDNIKYSGTYRDIKFEGEGEFDPNDQECSFKKIESEFEAKGINIDAESMGKIRTALLKELKNAGVGDFEYNDEFVINNQYAGKTADEIWEMWSVKQREHFLMDHFSSEDGPTRYGKMFDAEKAVISSYNDLPVEVKNEMRNHVHEGQYAAGGNINDKIFISYAPDKMVFVRIGSHRAYQKAEKTGIPFITLYNLYANGTAAQSLWLIYEKDYKKIENIKGISAPLKEIKSHGMKWHIRIAVTNEENEMAEKYKSLNAMNAPEVVIKPFYTKLLIDNKFDFNIVYPEKVSSVKEATEYNYDLNEVVEFLRKQSNNFTHNDSRLSAIDNKIKDIVEKWSKETGYALPEYKESISSPAPKKVTKADIEKKIRGLKVTLKMNKDADQESMLKKKIKGLEITLKSM